MRKKGEPVGVRFNLYYTEKIKKENDLKSNQAVVDYLFNLYRMVAMGEIKPIEETCVQNNTELPLHTIEVSQEAVITPQAIMDYGCLIRLIDSSMVADSLIKRIKRDDSLPEQEKVSLIKRVKFKESML